MLTKVQEYLSTTAIDHSTPQPQHCKHNLVKTFKLQSNFQEVGFSDFTDNFNNKEPFGAMW
jgi:hypothetical protein